MDSNVQLYKDSIKGQLWAVRTNSDGTFVIHPLTKPQQACGCDEIPTWLTKVDKVKA